MNPLHAHTRPAPNAERMTHPTGSLSEGFDRTPVGAWVLVLLVAAVSFCVHLLDVEVERGQGMREAQRAGLANAAPALHPGLRVATRAQR